MPNFLRARKRSQATTVLNDLRLIQSAMDQYAIDTNKKADSRVDWPDVQNYIKTGTRLYNSTGSDIFGHYYDFFEVDHDVQFSQSTFDSLSDVAPLDFWSPWTPAPGY